jgi:hypothetical protein
MIYFERILSCGCGVNMRQTTKTLPLDETGKSMVEAFEREFRREHNCSSNIRYSDIRYSDWIKIKYA